MLSFNMRRTLFRSLVSPRLDIENIKNVVIQKAIGFCVIVLSAALGFLYLLLYPICTHQRKYEEMAAYVKQSNFSQLS